MAACEPNPTDRRAESDDRRDFLARCGRFAVVTPPTMALLLSTSLKSEAIARSGGKDGGMSHSGGGGSPNGNQGHTR
jgi:hypothetical protein